MRAFQILSSAFVLFLVSSGSVSAQIHFTGAPSINPSYPNPGTPYAVDSSISSVATAETADGFKITGDVSLRYDRSAPPQPDGFQPVFQLVVDRPFTVGPLPVNVHGALTENLEAVLGNGSLTAPQMEFRTYGLFFINDGGYPFIPALQIQGIDMQSLSGNSFGIFNTNASSGPYILGPGFNYLLQYRIEAWIDNSLLSVNDPPPTLTFEFGGVSEFDGIEVSAIGVLLPEPSSIVIFSMGAILLAGVGLRRRRDTWRSRFAGYRATNDPIMLQD